MGKPVLSPGQFVSSEGLRGSVFQVSACTWKAVVLTFDCVALESLGHSELAAKRAALKAARVRGATKRNAGGGSEP